jgi:UPF0716 family protein affecting phage T7 exclusion
VPEVRVGAGAGREMRAMRRLASFALGLLLVVPAPASAAETATITGVVRNETTGRVQARARVTLLHLRQGDREPKTTATRTDERGRYRFDDLDTGDEHLYFVDVEHQGGLFSSGQIPVPDDTKKSPTIEVDPTVWDTTDDPTVIALRRNDLFLRPEDNTVAVIDSYRVFNISNRAYIGRGGPGADTTLAFPLPEDARGNGVTIVQSPRIDIPELRATEFGFGVTVAIPPGETNMIFSYPVDGSSGSYDLTRTALYPILDSSVFAQPPLEIRSNRLEKASDEPVEVGGDEYVEYAAPNELDAGDAIQVLAVAEAGMSPSLVAGAAVLLGVIALAVAAGIVLRRRKGAKTTARARRPEPAARDRESLVVAIAELDLRYRGGEIDEEEWRARREELKARVDERAPERTP